MKVKKWIVIILIVLLARIPLSEWVKISSHEAFLKGLCAVFSIQMNCKKATVGYMKVGNEILVFGDCVEEEIIL